jgi:hypothetical protein
MKGMLMKIRRIIVITVLMMVLMTTSVMATARVICEVEQKSDNSAEITLSWSEDNDEHIRITSWSKLDDSTLKVYYVKGDDVISGWNQVRVEGENYTFPMKIILAEQGSQNESFPDLPGTYEEKYSILNLYYRNIISGYPDGTVKPDNLVTRAEFSKMIVATACYELENNSSSIFSDVSNDFWGISYIMTLANKEILKGRTDGTFDPDGEITIGEVLAVINRTFVLYKGDSRYPYALEDHWSNDDFSEMVANQIVKSSDDYYYPYAAEAKATREQCAVLLSRVLEQLHEVN